MTTMETAIEKKACGLPNYYYTDARIEQQERELIFRRHWQMVGREEEIASSGDYLTCEVGGEPMIVTRNDEGQLRALYNVCAHRGMRLADGCGHFERLRCPYHAWTYDLNGRLRGVPFAECLPDLKPDEIRLQMAQVAVWGGFIFVHPDPEAESLASFLGEMPARWEAYHADWQGLREVGRLSSEEPFNWKLFMENSVDYYHVPFIHQATLDLPPVLKNTAAGRHFRLSSITPTTDYTRYFDLLFPNVYFHISPTRIQVFRVTPLAPDRCQTTVIFYQTPAQAAAWPIRDSSAHRDIAQVIEEDFRICRVLQRQAQSGAYRIRFTAQKLEEGVAHFDRMILELLEG